MTNTQSAAILLSLSDNDGKSTQLSEPFGCVLDRLKVVASRAHLRIGVAESLTSGHLQALIGSISGASTFFNGGVTAYLLSKGCPFST